MINQEPILIAGPPRSGTTMIAGLFSLHGVWIGRGRTTMYPGTNPDFVSENQDIKAVMKELANKVGYKNWDTPLPDLDLKEEEVKYMKELIEGYVPDNRRWLVKTAWTLIFSDFWRKAYPDALWVFPDRDVDLVIGSMNRHPGMAKRSDKIKKSFVRHLFIRQVKLMDLMSGVGRYMTANAKKISERNTVEINELLDLIGIDTPKWGEINDWIQPSIMR